MLPPDGYRGDKLEFSAACPGTLTAPLTALKKVAENTGGKVDRRKYADMVISATSTFGREITP